MHWVGLSLFSAFFMLSCATSADAEKSGGGYGATSGQDGSAEGATGGDAGSGGDGSGEWPWPSAGSAGNLADAGDSSGGDAGTGTGGTGGSGGGPSGECVRLESWKTSAPYADDAHVSHPLPSFGVDGRYYVHTMLKGGGERILKYAAQAADGSLGEWQVASPDHGGGPHGYTAIVAAGAPYHFRNGHIARYPLDASGKMPGDVDLLESNPDTAFGGNRYVWDSALVATVNAKSWVIHLGGFSFTGYSYAPNVYRSQVPVESSFTSVGMNHPAERPGKCAFVSPWLFTGAGGGDEIWRTRVHEDGTLEPWTSLGTLPAGTDNQRGDWFAIDGTLFVVRGTRVFGAKVDSQGSLGAFVPEPDLPNPQIDMSWGDGHLEGASYALM